MRRIGGGDRRTHTIVAAAGSVVLALCLALAAEAAEDDEGGFLGGVLDRLGVKKERAAPAPATPAPAATPSAPPLSTDEIGAGLREALRVGTGRVVDAVGRVDGFNADPEIHIPLPDYMQNVQSALELVGMGSLGEDLELRLNRAAETATPVARDVFVDSIAQMTLDDVRSIYNGPQDAATRYFQRTMTPDLVERMRPIVDDALAETGAMHAYDSVIGRYREIPMMPDVKGDLTDYALTKTLDGLFYKVAQEEAAIRSNPAARTTELLQRVFGI
jgi:hypothetical protein